MVSRDQLLLSLKPSVNFDTEYDSDDPPAGIEVDNAGPGPAVIESVRFYLDRKPFIDTEAVLTAANLLDADNITTLDLEKGDTLAVGDHLWLLEYKGKAHTKQQQKDQDQFADFIEKHVAVGIQFCSVVGNRCDTKCSVAGWCE